MARIRYTTTVKPWASVGALPLVPPGSEPVDYTTTVIPWASVGALPLVPPGSEPIVYITTVIPWASTTATLSPPSFTPAVPIEPAEVPFDVYNRVRIRVPLDPGQVSMTKWVNELNRMLTDIAVRLEVSPPYVQPPFTADRLDMDRIVATFNEAITSMADQAAALAVITEEARVGIERSGRIQNSYTVGYITNTDLTSRVNRAYVQMWRDIYAAPPLPDADVFIFTDVVPWAVTDVTFLPTPGS